MYYNKYIKYKTKYLNAIRQNQLGGDPSFNEKNYAPSIVLYNTALMNAKKGNEAGMNDHLDKLYAELHKFNKKNKYTYLRTYLNMILIVPESAASETGLIASETGLIDNETINWYYFLLNNDEINGIYDHLANNKYVKPNQLEIELEVIYNDIKVFNKGKSGEIMYRAIEIDLHKLFTIYTSFLVVNLDKRITALESLNKSV
jgi:hypothetical protein